MPDIARDNFARYFTEKLWDWIPAVYRNADGEETPHKHVLRAMIQAIGEHAAIARRSIDHLWDNQSIEVCDDWAVALIGELVGTRLVPALNRRGRRVDVARTIHYRRRSGTLHVLNQLILDIAGWDGAIVESFRTLGRTHHFLDPLPLPLGRYTHTPRAGTADLRRPRGTELVDGPWDEFFHTADLRPSRGRDGLHPGPQSGDPPLRRLFVQIVVADVPHQRDRLGQHRLPVDLAHEVLVCAREEVLVAHRVAGVAERRAAVMAHEHLVAKDLEVVMRAVAVDIPGCPAHPPSMAARAANSWPARVRERSRAVRARARHAAGRAALGLRPPRLARDDDLPDRGVGRLPRHRPPPPPGGGDARPRRATHQPRARRAGDAGPRRRVRGGWLLKRA